MRVRRSRHQIEQAIRSTQPWALVLTDGMDEKRKTIFDNRMKAIELYLEGDSILAIEDASGIGCAELYRTITRCISASPDGLVWGYRGLIPSLRLKSYERKSPLKSKLPESKVGYAGVFSNLLAKYPDLEETLIKKILKLKSDKAIYEYRIRPKHVHKAMIDFLKAKEHPRDEWPFNTKLLGSRCINTFVRDVLNHNFDRGVLVNGEASARAHLAVGTGKDAMMIYDQLMEAAELDSYHVDADFTIAFENADGLMSYVPIERLNILALVCRASTAVWWFRVVFRSEVGAADVVRMLTESLRTELPRPSNEILGITLSGDMGFPSQVFPELAHTLPTVLMPGGRKN